MLRKKVQPKLLKIISQIILVSPILNNIIYERIYNEANNTSRVKSFSALSLFKLHREIIFDYVINSRSPIIYYEIIDIIRDAIRGKGSHILEKLPVLEEESIWSIIIKYASFFQILKPDVFHLDLGNIRLRCAKEYDMAIAAKYLIGNGCKVGFENSNYVIQEGLEDYIQKIEELIQKIGGINVALITFKLLFDNKTYSSKLERYLITRSPKQFPDQSQPATPWGYLLSLSVKYPFFKEISISDRNTIFHDIVERITNLIFVYDLQPYSIFENMFVSRETLIKFTQDIALFDSTYTFPQMKPAYTEQIINGINKFLDEKKFIKCTGFSLRQFIYVFNKLIIQIAKLGPIIIEIDKIFKNSGINSKVQNKIMRYLSHDKKNINENFHSIYDQEKNNFWFKPLVKLSNNKYLLYDKIWCSPAFLEVFLTILREQYDNKIDDKIGIYLEDLLKNKLKNDNLVYSCGKYNVDGHEGETDLIIETSKSIIIIEIKKKTLTRKSRSGFDVSIVIDLMDSLIDSQLQTNKVELILREKGLIELKDSNDKMNKIYFQSRKIERFSISLFDYGGFQDRDNINQILKLLVGTKLGTRFPTLEKKFETINEKLNKLTEDYNKLVKMDNSFAHFPFFSSWFISIPQFLMLLENANTADDLYNNLLKVKHLTTKSCDFYFEYLYGSHLQSLSKK